MLDEEMFVPNDVTISNIFHLASEQKIFTERRICEIAELADDAVRFSRKILDAGASVLEALSLISGGCSAFIPKDSDMHIAVNHKRLEFMLSSLSIMDKAHFAQIYVELFAKEHKAPTENDFMPTLYADQSFVYVKNVFADEAYDVFSQDFSDPRVKYAKDFRQAVKMVSDADVTYCILPLEERGARISTIAELLFKHELKINSVIPVYGMDANADIKYALVSRHFTVPKRYKDDDRYLEIRVPANLSIGLSGLLLAAESYGATLYRVNTQTFDTNDGPRGYYSVVFTGEDVDFTTLLVFLTLFVPEYAPVGIYKNLEL